MEKLTYGSYLKIDELLALQQPLSDPPRHDELLFIVIHQVYELWFKQMLHEIDAAIREIKRAAIDDGKGDADPFPIDRHLSPHDRFRKANELLSAAHRELDHAEDVPQSRGLRDRAMGHIDEAHRIVDDAWRKAHW